MKALTARQQEVFDLIRDHISQTGMPPTRAEIAQRLVITLSFCKAPFFGRGFQTRLKNI